MSWLDDLPGIILQLAGSAISTRRTVNFTNGPTVTDSPANDRVDIDFTPLATKAESSTDNAVVRFDGATGRGLQSSAVTIDDDGLFVPVSKTVAQLNAIASPATGAIAWCSDESTGATWVGYDGTNWVLLEDNATVIS